MVGGGLDREYIIPILLMPTCLCIVDVFESATQIVKPLRENRWLRHRTWHVLQDSVGVVGPHVAVDCPVVPSWMSLLPPLFGFLELEGVGNCQRITQMSHENPMRPMRFTARVAQPVLCVPQI